MHPAAIYNEKRRIIFSTYHSKGLEEASQYLEGYRSTLGNTGYTGLKAELEFYSKHQREYSLTVAGDMGEHADFAGNIGNKPVRFDITTNVKYKELKTYEKFLCEGYDYRIAILDNANWEIIDVLELSFPKCDSCGDSFSFPLAITHPMNYNRHGDPLWHSDQDIIGFCPACCAIEEKEKIYNSPIKSFSELHSDLYELPENELITHIKAEFRSSVKYLSKESGLNLIGIAENGSRQDSKYEDPENGIYFPYLSDMVSKYFEDFYGI